MGDDEQAGLGGCFAAVVVALLRMFVEDDIDPEFGEIAAGAVEVCYLRGDGFFFLGGEEAGGGIEVPERHFGFGIWIGSR